MTRTTRPSSPLHLYLPLYDPTLNLLATLLSLSLLLPANTQMISPNITLANKTKDISNEIIPNYTNVEEFTITPKTNDDNELINNVSSINYQTLIDRFRRKNDSTTEITTLANKTVDIDDEYQIYLELEDDNHTDGLDNNSMEKLRVDDATRTKIFNDFSKTVKIYKNLSKIPVDKNVRTTDSVDMKTMADRKDVKRVSNGSLGFPTRVPTSYHVPSITDVQHTPRPGFIEGK